MILAIDPGPESSGLVLYDEAARRVVEAHAAMTLTDVLAAIRVAGVSALPPYADGNPVVAIERMQSYGIAGASLLDTARIAGRMEQRAHDFGLLVVLLYRRDILRALDVTGQGSRDALVRQRLLEMHPGGTGTAKAPGPLRGTSGHAWAALAVAVAAGLGARSE